MGTGAAGFVRRLAFEDLPDAIVERGKLLLLDTIGVAVAGAGTEPAAIARRAAALLFPAGPRDAGGQARALFRGGALSPAGAAFAGATAIDSVDAHDGHQPSKGHAGVALLPGLLALAETGPACDGREFLTCYLLGYELAHRAAVALHTTVGDYHTSGAWNALAVAALGARRFGLPEAGIREALGIAEYWGPRSQMMRVIDQPSMLKDGSGWGALVGVTAAVMAREGFTGAPAVTVEAEAVAPLWQDLGSRWLIPDVYVKAYPVCFWAQGPVTAVMELRREHGLRGDEIAAIRVETFHAATRLAERRPATSDHAQYSLPFPAAAAAVHGRLGLEQIDGPGLADPAVLKLAAGMELVERFEFEAAFPQRRLCEVELTLTDGRKLRSGPTEPKGHQGAPLGQAEIEAKFEILAGALPEPRREAIREAVLALEEQGDLAPFLDLLLEPA
ncbi:2-methylcitrate dehydratase PrpD [Tistlia consotensis]|uniref:2-methylcitrate dehydratase PrpD n=1 Tax=Tistlia consotensis USBA 355 TaxID=560819 RepID=A0A1Y6BT37_9PROT|nr:MmgE/PrpD family protein [Tistlia consotensis]SMF25552.1 2-methylcitrate dehydratase PrpD [Tistlia consotensis USBA 355]SNR59188.1 2-methylcitrate dehydratase PrpD [Tistlia consotensis]